MLSGKGKKWFLIFLGIFLFLLVTAQSLVHLLVEPSIEAFVRELVELRSNDRYKVKSLEVDWNLSARTIALNDVSIVYEGERGPEAPQNIFDFSFPHIELQHFFFREFLATRKIHTERLYIEEPQISCLREERSIKDRTNIQKSLYEIVAPQIKGIEIDEFEIKGGKLSYNDQKNFKRNSFVAENLNFMAEEVLMDSTAGSEFLSWFRVKEADLEIDVDKYVHITADSSYVLKAGKIGLSSRKSEFFVDDLHVEPNLRAYSSSRGPNKNLFEIKVPRIVIQDIKPREIAINRNVNLGAVRLVQPQLIQLGKFKSDSLRQKLPELSDLYLGIQPYFNNINIEGLSIEKGSFAKIAAMGDTSKQISLEGIGLYMQNLVLDSAMMKKEARLMLAEELDLKVDAYKFLLKEDSYIMRGKSARISSFAKQISGEGMSILPLDGTRRRLQRLNQDILDLEVPELQIEGVDLAELWHDRILEVDRVSINQPIVGLTNYPEIKKEKIDEISEQNLNLLIGGYLKKLEVKSLDIRGGTFDFKAGKDVLGDGFKARELEVNIRNFQLNPSVSKKADRPFYADDIRIDMEVDNYSLTLPDSSYSIQARHLGIATSDSSFYADSLVFTPLKAAQKQYGVIANIVVPRSYFHGLDVYKSYFEEELRVDSVLLAGAQIKLTDLGRKPFAPKKQSFLEDIDLYPAISSVFKGLQLDRLILQKAHLELEELNAQETYVLPQLALDVRGFKLDSAASHQRNLFYAKDIRIQAANFFQNLPDSLHQISVGNLDISTEKGDVRLCEVDIRPRNQGTESIGQKYRIKLPDLQLKGLDLYDLLSNRNADMQMISIDTPTVELERYPDIEKEEIDSLAKANLYDFISAQLNSLRVRQLKVNQGKLQVNDYQGGTNEFKAENLNLYVSDFRLDSSSANRTDDLFYAQHIELGARVEDYYIMLPDSSYAMRIGNVGISTSDSSIYAENIRLLPQWNSDKLRNANQAWELSIPRVNMAGIDPDEWYFEKSWTLVASISINPLSGRLSCAKIQAEEIRTYTISYIPVLKS